LGGLSFKEKKYQDTTQVEKIRTKICEEVLNLLTVTQSEICYIVNLSKYEQISSTCFGTDNWRSGVRLPAGVKVLYSKTSKLALEAPSLLFVGYWGAFFNRS